MKTWQATPNNIYFNKYGETPFLLKCNYDFKHFDKKMPLLCKVLLDYFKDVRSGFPDMNNSNFIFWNNEEITIENKSILWKYLFEKGIFLLVSD